MVRFRTVGGDRPLPALFRALDAAGVPASSAEVAPADPRRRVPRAHRAQPARRGDLAAEPVGSPPRVRPSRPLEIAS